MGKNIIIALDAMGGDEAPAIILDGAALVAESKPDSHFLLFGDAAILNPMVEALPSLRGRTEIRHTDQVIAADEKPSQALRRGRQSSMRLAIDAVRNGEAAGIVSAGNTGALMAMSKFVLKTLPGIDRPAIASVFPSAGDDTVMLDLGANLDCDAENLVQFAMMGATWARVLWGRDRPTVGLLNVGAEDMKGHVTIQDAQTILRSADLPLQFHGFVEGDDIAKGTTDVIVTDGFSGNIALKSAEGTAKLYSQFLREAFSSSLLAKIGYLLAGPAMRRLRQKVDPRRYNGGIFLGLNGISIKSHGGTDATGFAAAISLASDMIEGDLSRRLAEDLQRFGSATEPPRQVSVS